jgi:hypothetical protein
MVWGELWNLYGSVIFLVSFDCVFVDTPSLTAFIGGPFSWFSHQESIGSHHSFEALPFYFLFTCPLLVVLGAFCMGSPTLSL